MQGTAAFHHESADPLLPQADPVLHHTAALATAGDVRDAQPTLVKRLVRPLVLPRALLAAGLLGRHDDRHLRERERQAPQIRPEPTPRRQGIRRRVRNGLLMRAAARGIAQDEDEQQRVDAQDICDRRVLCLAALTGRLGRRVLGTDAPPCRPVMGPRGEAGAAAGLGATGAGAASSASPPGAASTAATPSRWARAVRERAGASPRARNAASSTGKRACIHGCAVLCPMPHPRPWTTWSADVFR